MPTTLLLDPPPPYIFTPSQGSENVLSTNEVLDTTTQWHSKKRPAKIHTAHSNNN